MRVLSVVATVVGAFIVGGGVGYPLGRWTLERTWEAAQHRMTDAERAQATVNDPDPVPPVGAMIYGPMPIGRLRATLHSVTAADPVKVTVGSLGVSDNGPAELHLVAENHGTCTVTGFAGVAYGFDPHGRPAAMNRRGETFVAFRAEGLTLAPGAKTVHAAPRRYAPNATLVVAHVDEARCADGSEWKR